MCDSTCETSEITSVVSSYLHVASCIRSELTHLFINRFCGKCFFFKVKISLYKVKRLQSIVNKYNIYIIYVYVYISIYIYIFSTFHMKET
jgi:hypothetical protein